MARSGVGGVNNSNMSEDLLINILSRLQVKSLLCFKCVSKYWNTLIESPDFIKNHYRNLNNCDMLLVLHYLNLRFILADPDPDCLSNRYICKIYGYDIVSDNELYNFVTNSNRFTPIANISSSDDEFNPDTTSNKADSTSSNNFVRTYPKSSDELHAIYSDGIYPEQAEVWSKEFALAMFHNDDIRRGQPQPPPYEDIIDITRIFSCVYYWHNIIGPVDGLFLLHNGCAGMLYYNKLALWNPATTELKLLPLPNFNFPRPRPYCVYVFGFGVDPLTNSYKVVWIPEKQWVPPHEMLGPPNVAVYSLATNSWRPFNVASPHIHEIVHSNPKYLNGACYWLSNRVLSTNGKQIRNINIVSFDMGSDVFHDIQVPDNVNNLENFSQDITLVLHNDDSIALLVCDYFSPRDCLVESIEVWVMKHEKEGGCWTKLFTLGLGPHLQLETPVGFWKNYNEIFFITKTQKLVLYNSDTDEITHLGVQCDPDAYTYKHSIPIFNYKESLVSVGGRKKQSKRGKLHAMVQSFVAFQPTPP
ncbi:hypothetical protein LguiA_025530 [Lonicera macranthoides]